MLEAVPGLVAFFKEFGEDPTVVGVTGGVQDGDANSSVVGKVEMAAGKKQVVVAADDDVGLELSYFSGDGAAEG